MAEQPALGFAGLLRQLRAEATLTQEELAEAAPPWPPYSPQALIPPHGYHGTARPDIHPG